MLATETNEHDQIRAIQPWYKTRLHRHAVRVFDAGRETEHIHMIAADVAHEVGQVSQCGYNADFLRARAGRRQNESRAEDGRR